VRSLRCIGALAVLAALAVAAPAAAQEGPAFGPSGPASTGAPAGQQTTGQQPSGGSSTAAADVPSRVESRLARASRSLQRAEDAIDDADNAKGIASLRAVTRNLAGAARAAKRRATADDGPASFAAVAGAQHEAIDGVVDLFDGVIDTDVLSQLGATLKSALDGRDDLVATINGLTSDQKAGYADVARSISSDIADETSGVEETLSDDTLKDPEAKDALNAALTQLKASATAIQALISDLPSQSSATATDTASTTATSGTSGQGRGDCPRGQPNGTPSSGSGPQTATASGRGGSA
jgi:hypothetical protein